VDRKGCVPVLCGNEFPPFDLASWSGELLAIVTSGLEIISGNGRAAASTSSNQVLAGFDSTKMSTELIY
jgi:hypothetical protein